MVIRFEHTVHLQNRSLDDAALCFLPWSMREFLPWSTHTSSEGIPSLQPMVFQFRPNEAPATRSRYHRLQETVRKVRNPTHGAVGGLFRYGLQDRRPAVRCFFFLFPSLREGKEEEENGESGAPVCRLSLNNPPTAVGGISDFSHSLLKPMVSTTLTPPVVVQI